MKNKDYISDGLVHVRDRLKEYAHPVASGADAASEPKSEDTTMPRLSRQPMRPGRGSVDNKTLSKARLKRGEDYWRFHRDLTAKLTACQAALTEEARHCQRTIEESAKFQEAVDQMLKELEELRDLDGTMTADPVKLGENFRKAEHLRLEFIRRQTGFCQLTGEHGGSKSHASTSPPSMLPELGSLEFSQIFKIGLACGLPIIIALLGGCVIIALAILLSMGVFR